MKSDSIKIFAIIIFWEIVITLILAPISRAENENFTLTANKTVVDVNDTFDVDLDLTNGMQNQNQLTVIIQYDSSKLEIIPDAIDADENGILLQDESIYSNILNSEDGITLGFVNDDGSISIVYYTNSEEKYLATSGTLAQLKFKAIKGGTAKISYDTIEYAYENDEPSEITSNSELTIDIKEQNIKGDINGDGKVSLLDYGLVLAHVKRTKLLEGEQLQRADINGDNKVSLLDYGLILAHVKRTKLLF